MKKNNQITGNIGMYFVCYMLSARTWNVLPTSRNAKGIDAILYNEDVSKTFTIQVKTVSNNNAVSLGRNPVQIADFVIICSVNDSRNPECYILTKHEAEKLAERNEKDGKASYWINQKKLKNESLFQEWNRVGL